MLKPRKIGVLTSGGDAPGMNACIRAVTRTALDKNIDIIGIRKGYNGLLAGDIKDLNSKVVSDIVHRGGTILHTARSKEMMQPEGQERAAKICKVLGIDSLIVIGGDGSFKGGLALSKLGIDVIGIPATIDLDIACTEYTIGFDTAVNTGMDAINRLRDTSNSHERCSVVEVMGRDAGYIGLWSAMAGGAEEVWVPEQKGEISSSDVIQQILKNRSKGKRHNLIVVAEGIGGSQKLAEEIQETTGIQTRATILGHLQRGGSPTALDRVHASRMGYYAVDLIEKGIANRIVIYKNGQYSDVDLEEGINMPRVYDETMYNIVKVLAI